MDGSPWPEPRDWRGVRLVVQTWLGTRVVFALVAVQVMITEGRTLPEVVGNWDVQHFLAIAADGYADPHDVAFFPGWPLLLRAVDALGVPMLAAGVVLALAFSAVAAAALYRLGGAPAAIAWLLAPAAVFTAVPYTESLFCAAASWAWERAVRGRWGSAAALACVAAAVRVSGVFLIAALAVLALTRPGPALRRVRRLAWLLLPSGVVAAYLVFLRVVSGDWAAWYHAQADNWSRGFTWPWVSLEHTWQSAAPGAYADHPEWAWLFRAELLSMAVGLVATLVLLARRRAGEAVWVGSQVLAFATSYWFISVNRAVLLWFPVWTMAGEAAERLGRSRAGGVTVGLGCVLAVLVQAGWAWLFFTGRWAG